MEQLNEDLIQAVKSGDIKTVVKCLQNGAEPNYKELWSLQGETALHYAAKSNQKDIVELLLSRGATINIEDNWNRTPLHQAVDRKCKDIVALLLSRGADINIKDNYGKTPLHMAAENNLKDFVSLLLSRRADINIKDLWDKAPLHIAAEKNLKDIVELLLSRGADINIKNGLDKAPLHIAAEKNLKDIVELLLSRGADINIKNGSGNSPLHSALLEDNKELVDLLLSHGADHKFQPTWDLLQSAKSGNIKTAEICLDNGANIKYMNHHGKTSLHIAAESNQKDIAALLLLRGADVNFKGHWGITALYVAAKSNHTDIVILLLSRGADINIKDDMGITPLHVAAKSNHTDIVILLLSSGADINIKDNMGITALHVAAKSNHTDIVILLSSRGADINIKDNMGITPLHVAAKSNHTDMVKLLLSSGADINIKDNMSLTPLHVATKSNHTDIVQLLLSRGADINIMDARSLTPLHVATKSNHTDIVQLLLSRGADINIKDARGKKPVHLALSENNKEMVDLLLSKDKVFKLKATLNLLQAAKCGDIKAIKVCLETGADINYQDDSLTALHVATQNNYTDIVQLLLSRGADINIKDARGKVPIHYAAESYHTYIADLLSSTANVNIKDNSGKAPIHYAAVSNHRNIVDLLLSLGADVNIKDNSGRTPLFMAAGTQHITDMVALLLSRGADINMTDIYGMTPLHIAVKTDHTDVVDVLVSLGADINIKNNDNETAIDSAQGKDRILLELIGKGLDANQALEIVQHGKNVVEAENDIRMHSKQAAPTTIGISESSDKKQEDVFKDDDDTALRVILDATEFKGILSKGSYEAFWNRIYLAGACNVGKTTLASLLIGEDIPKYWNSTDGLRIYFGMNGIDINQRKMIPLKKGLGRRDVLSKVLRGKPNIEQPDLETTLKCQKSQKPNIEHDFDVVSPEKGVCSSSTARLFDTHVSFGVQTTSYAPPKQKKTRERKLEHTRKLSRLEFTSVHDDIKRELRKGEYKVKVAASDLVDFGGQRSYDMTHQLFIQSKGAFTLLFDGRKGLRDPLVEEYPQGDVTSESILKHWVHSILTYCGGRDDDILPVILFVATHSDCLTEDQKLHNTAEFKEDLTKLFSNHPQHRRILFNDVFFINGRDINDTEVDRLKSKYVDIAFQQKSWGNKMPMAWVPLELQLSEMRTNNISIISKDELIDINRANDDLALTEEQLDQFLKVQHALGKILYFESYELRRYVIVQPTSLVDILRSFITDEMFWPKEKRLKRILKEMTDTGTIRKTDLFRLWSQDEFNLHMPDDDFKDFVVQVLIHLDLLVEPKRYIHSPCTDFFLVPCIVKRGPTDDFITSPREDNTISLSYKLLKSPIPSALAFKLIGAVLDVWPLKETHQGVCLYHKAAILCIDQSHELYLWVKDDRVQVFLLNTTSKRFISKDFASCAQECLTLTMISSLEFYHSSFGNIVSKSAISDLFEIEVGERCRTDTCYISLAETQRKPPLMRDSWTCKHGKHHATKYLFYWTHAEKRQECPPDCPGLDANCLQMFPEDKHLARLSSYIGIKKFDQFIISLGMSRDEWESLEYKYQRADVLMMKIDALCQMKKKVSKGPSFQDLYNALIAVNESIHILCKIFREDRTILDIDNMALQTVPDGKTLKELSRNMGNCASQLGIELGINTFEIEATIYRYNKNMFKQNYDILKKWKKAPHGNKTIRTLMHALWIVDRRGCEFLKDKYKIVH